MFVDRVRVKLTAGAGGNGCRSFRREMYVPLGGPNGGDGGNGGDVVFRADRQLTSLLDIRYRSHIVGKRGVHGKGKDMHGKCAPPTYVRVPCGTVIKDFETEEIVADLTEDGQEFVAAHGGKGGRGNARFASAANRIPNFAEKGEPGDDIEYLLELKLIADVGIVGMPNAGKSTLTAKISEATPKIAAYPFTTLTPNLAVVPLPGYRSLTIADIPGIIEGAAEGKGLGHQFLRHIERTRVLLFLIDLGDEDPVATRDILLNELRQYSDAFDSKPQVFALNKADLPDNRAKFEEVSRRFEHVYCLSGATGEGIHELIEQLWQMVDRVRKEEEGKIVIEPDKVYTFEPPYEIVKERGVFFITGKRVLRAVRMTDFDNEEAVRHLQDTFRHMGIFEALRRMGAEPGDAIDIGGVEMEYTPE